MPLSTKGEFYPIGLEPSEDRDNQDEGLHRLSSLLRRSLPLRVRLVAGPALPPPLHPTLAAGFSFVHYTNSYILIGVKLIHKKILHKINHL